MRVTLLEPRQTLLDFIDRHTIDKFCHQIDENGADLRLGSEMKALRPGPNMSRLP